MEQVGVNQASGKEFKTLDFPYHKEDPQKSAVKRNRIEVTNARVVQLLDILSAEECQYLIKKGEELTFENIEKEYPKEYRNNERLLFTSETFTSTIWNRMLTLVSNDMKGARPIGTANEGVWEPHSLNPVWRFCKYTKGGKFAPHFDGCHVNFQNERSIFSLIIYLNDNFKGGDTQFLESKESLTSFVKGNIDADKVKVTKEVKPVQGSALVFNHDVLHQGTELTEGVKYILRTDIVFRLAAGEMSKIDAVVKDENFIKSSDHYLLSDKLEKEGDTKGSTEQYLKGLETQAPAASLSISLSSKPLTSLNDLFDDILMHIFQFLCKKPFKEYFNLCLVCHRWERLLKHNQIWIERCRRDLPLTAQLESKLFQTAEHSWLNSFKKNSLVVFRDEREEQKKKQVSEKSKVQEIDDKICKERDSLYLLSHNKFYEFKDKTKIINSRNEAEDWAKYQKLIPSLTYQQYKGLTVDDKIKQLDLESTKRKAQVAEMYEQEKSESSKFQSLRTLVLHLDCEESALCWADASGKIKNFPTVSVTYSYYSHSHLMHREYYGAQVAKVGNILNQCEDPSNSKNRVNHLLRNGVITNSELLRGFLNECWSEMETTAAKSPFMFVYPPMLSEDHQRSLLSMFMTSFQVPRFSMVNAATAAVFSTGELSGLAVYIGNNTAWVAPVINSIASTPIIQQYERVEIETGVYRENLQPLIEKGLGTDPTQRALLLSNVAIYCSAWVTVRVQSFLNTLKSKYGDGIKITMASPITGASAFCLCPQYPGSSHVIDRNIFDDYYNKNTAVKGKARSVYDLGLLTTPAPTASLVKPAAKFFKPPAKK